MKAIISTWKTLTDTLSVMGQHRSYSFYPLLSYTVTLLVMFTAVIPLFEGVLGLNQEDVLAQVVFFLVVYLAYGVLYFVIAFCNVALVTGIAGRLDGDDPPFSRGVLAAFQRIGPIARYTLVSATLGLLSYLARVLINPLFGMFIAPTISNQLWVRWRQLSYDIPLLMAVPVIALDQPAPENTFKRGALLVKETWGERVKPAHSIGLLALLVLLPVTILVATPILRQGLGEHNPTMIRLGLSIMLIAIGTYTQVSALVNVIFALAAYHYATARKSDVIPGDASYDEYAFVKPKKDMDEGAASTALISPSPSGIADDLSN